MFVDGIGLLGPGLKGWPSSAPIFAGRAAYAAEPIVMPPLELLLPTERRRTPFTVKLAMLTGQETVANAHQPAEKTATVFTSSGSDGDAINQICDTLASSSRRVSPTRFHNSVHNAPAGYWGIAMHAHEPSTSLCAYDASFAAGLIEAVTQCAIDQRAVLLVAYDSPYPEPLNGARHVSASIGIGLLLAPAKSPRSICGLEIVLTPNGEALTPMQDPALEAIRKGVSAGRGLPLLAAIASGGEHKIAIEYTGETTMKISVGPC